MGRLRRRNALASLLGGLAGKRAHQGDRHSSTDGSASGDGDRAGSCRDRPPTPRKAPLHFTCHSSRCQGGLAARAGEAGRGRPWGRAERAAAACQPRPSRPYTNLQGPAPAASPCPRPPPRRKAPPRNRRGGVAVTIHPRCRVPSEGEDGARTRPFGIPRRRSSGGILVKARGRPTGRFPAASAGLPAPIC